METAGRGNNHIYESMNTFVLLNFEFPCLFPNPSKFTGISSWDKTQPQWALVSPFVKWKCLNRTFFNRNLTEKPNQQQHTHTCTCAHTHTQTHSCCDWSWGGDEMPIFLSLLRSPASWKWSLKPPEWNYPKGSQTLISCWLHNCRKMNALLLLSYHLSIWLAFRVVQIT